MEELVREVEIVGMAITQQYGTLTSGTILKVPAEFAKHLVDEAQAAKYTERDLLLHAGNGKGKAGVSGGAGKPSEGLTVQQLKEKLTEKSIVFPTDAKKADLADLLDAPAVAVVDGTPGKPSDGLGLDELRAALVAADIEFKDDATAEELAALLDGQVAA